MTPDYDSDFTTTDRMLDFDLDHMLYQADRPRQYAAGRRCCHDGCKTILSRYNSGETCELHEPEPDFTVYLGMQFHVCDTCGRLDFEKAFRRLTHDERATTCLKCEAKDRAAKMKTARAKETAGAVRGCLRMVPCNKCHALRPADSKHFTIRLGGVRNSTCRVCERKKRNDRYHIKTYGMTRAEYKARGNS